MIAKGYSQRKGADYDEILFPMVRRISIKVVLAMVAHLDIQLEQMDVKTYFFHSDLEEKIYIDQTEWFNQPR